jgi:dephospho-CoA kinase
MRVLGLTGGIGSGKSMVDAIFRELGAEVIDADVLAREVVEPGQPALTEIVASFGAQLLQADGRLDRAQLAEIVFGDASARARLNAITHPRIRERLQQEVAARASRPGLLILDIPLLYESGRQEWVEKVLVVWVDPDTQRRRLIQRDHLRPEQAQQRIDAQLSLDEKRVRADEVIDNSGTLEETRRQVEAVFRRYA